MIQHFLRSSLSASFTGMQRALCRTLRKGAGVISLRVLTLLSLCTVLGSTAVFSNTSQAFATQAKPPTDWSYYVSSASTGEAYNLGCNQGHFDAGYSPAANSEVILDFGEQWNSDGSGGADLIPNNIEITNAQIQAYAEAFSHGYWACTGANDTTSKLILAIGTSNYGNSTTASGTTWKNNVAAIQSYNQSLGYAAQVAMMGADDIESWCPENCVSPSAAMAWASGFGATYKYLDYGSADDCPTTSSNNGACAGAWNQYYYWEVSWGESAALPVPEIYSSAMAQQWAMISLYGSQYQQGQVVHMQGPMDDTSYINAPTAWNDLWNDLNSNSATRQNMQYSIEIHTTPS